MCSAPDPPKPEKVPVHQAMILPDAGDPAVRASLRGNRKLARSAMMFSNSSGALGTPMTAAIGAA